MAQTRLTLRNSARLRADQDNSTFPSDSTYNLWLDESGRKVWYDLVMAGWPVQPANTTINPTGTQYTAVGVAGIAFITGVWRVDGSTFIELPRIPEGQRGSWMSNTSSQGEGYSVVISQSGFAIEILPKARGSYRVDYILAWDGFTGDSDTWWGPPRSDELVSLMTAAKAVRKEGNTSEAAALMQEYADLLGEVSAMASQVDMRNAATIRDIGPSERSRRGPFDYQVEMMY